MASLTARGSLIRCPPRSPGQACMMAPRLSLLAGLTRHAGVELPVPLPHHRTVEALLHLPSSSRTVLPSEMRRAEILSDAGIQCGSITDRHEAPGLTIHH